MTRARRWGLGAGVAVGIAALVAAGYLWGSSRGDSRTEAVAARGAGVMPFDLDRTTHRFQKRAGGGVQTVVVDEPVDREQVTLVREHLRKEADEFRAGRFDDPAAIHGEEMPGLAALRSGADRLEIRYSDVPTGGRVSYWTDEPELVAALHAWFDAQVVDHGAHAETARAGSPHSTDFSEL